jgi:hypothetical protein
MAVTVYLKPNTKKAHYGRVTALSAIEPPVWLTLLSQTEKDARVMDMEAEDIAEDGIAARLQGLGADRVVILATGTHPSAHIQQSEAAFALKRVIEAGSGIPVEVHDRLPFDPSSAGEIDWDRLPLGKYRAHNWHAWGRPDRSYGATFASVSCPFHCDFCCVQDFYGSGYRQRAPGLVAGDVARLLRRGITNIKMMDELFAIDNAGVRAVLEALCALAAGELNIWAYARVDTVNASLLRALRSAGVRWLAYGIESASPAVRAGAMKGTFTNDRIREVVAMTRDAGIHVLGNFMFGFWEDDGGSMRATLDLALELKCEYANFYCMSVYPGSKLYAGMKARGIDLPEKGEEFAQMSPRFKPVPTDRLSGGEVLKFRDAAFREYFSDSAYLSMMQRTFGTAAVDEIRAMTAIDIRQKGTT